MMKSGDAQHEGIADDRRGEGQDRAAHQMGTIELRTGPHGQLFKVWAVRIAARSAGMMRRGRRAKTYAVTIMYNDAFSPEI